jgi:ABC-2 type transport system ATP-binding protein
MDHGRVLARGSVSDLIEQMGEGDVVILSGSFTAEELRETLEKDERIHVLNVDAGRALLSVSLHGPEAFRLLDGLIGRLPSVEEISLRKPSLQSLFIKLTGREIRD